MTQDLTVAVIGKGNMAKTVIGGLMTKGLDSSQIILSSPSINHQPFYEMILGGTTHKIKVAPSNQAAVEQANAVILVVKPFHAQTALSSIADALGSKPLVSAMAGITISTIRALLDLPNANITRLMPNTPATIGKGIGASFCDAPTLSALEQQYVNIICAAFGCPIELSNETLLNAVTATSGSGSAYVYLLIECLLEIYQNRGINEKLAMKTIEQHFVSESLATASADALLIRQFKNDMKQSAIEMNIDENNAIELVDKTFSGAMAFVQQEIQQNPLGPIKALVVQLRTNVTSKGGTTFAALECFRKNGLIDVLDQLMSPAVTNAEQERLFTSLNLIIKSAMMAASTRAEEMAEDAKAEAMQIKYQK